MYVKSLIVQTIKDTFDNNDSISIPTSNELNNENSSDQGVKGLTLPPHWRQINQPNQTNNIAESKIEISGNEIEEDNISLGVD